MKRNILLSALLLVAVGVQAKEISEQRAREIAATVIPSLSDASMSAPHRAPGLKSGAPSPYYLFNAAKGYVVVAGDDQLPPVLGYSPDGYIDPDNMPEAMAFLLDMSTKVLGAEATAASAMEATPGTPVVEPLLGDINWGQDAPFNTLCPMLGEKHGYVGCVATAMAQIMRFYGYPAKGTGSHSYVDGTTQHSVDFGAATYDWANMPNVVPDSPTDAQTSAYSTLSYHLGVAVDMNYATNGSGAYTHVVPGALRNYFGYTPSLRMHTRDYYNTNEWMAMIKSELDAGRPVYYSASSEDGLGGHAFVCDGYDSEGYVHMNWGWYGSSNGYFYINHLNPGELGTGGGGGAYNISQEILTHFMPAVEGDKKAPAIYSDTRFSCDAVAGGIMTMCFVSNLDTEAFDGEIMTVVADTKGNVLVPLKSENVKIDGFKAGKTGMLQLTMRDVPNSVSGIADGSYRLNFAYKTADMDAPELLRHPIGLPAYAECYILGGQIMVNGKHEPKPDVTMTTALEPDGEIYANGSVCFNVNVRNDSHDFRLSTVVLTLTNTDNPDITFSKEFYVNVYDLSAADLTMRMDLPEEIVPGSYKVTLAHKNHPDLPFATYDSNETLVEVLPEISNAVIRFTSEPVWQNGTQSGSTTLRRGDMFYVAAKAANYAAAGQTMVVCRFVDADGKSVSVGGDSYSWTKGEQRTLTVSNYIYADPGVYTMKFSYVDDKGHEVAINTPEATVEVVDGGNEVIEVLSLDMPSAMKSTDRAACSITFKGLKNTTGRLYIRVRHLNYKDGELVYMGTRTVVAGQEQTVTFNYKPGVADGQYLTMVEFTEGSATVPAAGHANYYKEITIGEQSGIGAIEADEDADAPVEWYTLQGFKVTEPTAGGIYIRRQGARSSVVRF